MLPIVDLPLNPGEKYALIAVNGATDISEVIDLGNGLFELPGGGFRLPEHWREWIGSVESEQIETRTGLLLLAKRASDRPEVLDAENQQLQRQTQWLYWGLLATGRFWIQGGATQVTGTYSEGQVSVAQKGRMLDVFNIQGLQPVRIGEADLRRAARLAGNLGDLMVRRGMRRVKLALRTFWSAFEEKDLGQRIHQFVRVASEGFAKSFGHREFIERSRVFVGKGWMVECGQLYRMRNNAEHFNLPDSINGSSQINGFGSTFTTTCVLMHSGGNRGQTAPSFGVEPSTSKPPSEDSTARISPMKRRKPQRALAARRIN